jgi:DNA polymerase I
LQVHDEIILETPIAQADQVMQILLDKMSVNQPLLVPVEIQIAKGFNWAECK